MKNQSNETNNLTQSQNTTRKSYGDNPVNSINRLKSINDNIEMMKNRYMVLRRRDEQIKYKTIDQQKKLNFHHMIHERLKNEREELRKSLQEIRDTKEVKERSQSMRRQINQRISSAKKQLFTSNLQKYEHITEEANKNKELIESKKEAELQTNRERALSLKKLEQQQKEMIQKKIKDKRENILANKSAISYELREISTERQKILQKLQKDEIEMIKESSKSIENSRLVSQKFTEIMRNLPSFKSKKGDKFERSSFLPTIRQKNNNSSLQVVIV